MPSLAEGAWGSNPVLPTGPINRDNRYMRSPRSEAQRLASAQNGRRGSGPRTAEGRARAAQNSTSHGIRSDELTVLPHERSDEVVQHVERVLADLGVQNYTEIMVGKRVALRLMQQRRLEDIEARRLRAEVDERLDATDEMKLVRLIEGTATALGTMISVMSSSFPAERDALDQLLVPINSVIGMLDKIEDTGAKVFVGRAALADAVGRLREESPVQTDVGAYRKVVEVAGVALTGVQDLVAGATGAEAKRVEIAGQMPLPDDHDAKLRRRYAADLDRRIAADMRLLAALREQRAATAASGSLGEPAQVQVRLVR